MPYARAVFHAMPGQLLQIVVASAWDHACFWHVLPHNLGAVLTFLQIHSYSLLLLRRFSSSMTCR